MRRRERFRQKAQKRPVRYLDQWKETVRRLKLELHALSLAYRDPRVPWHAKALLVLVLAYALSPIDLIPDFIPIFGYVDDLVLLPIGIYFAVRMIPGEVLAECRRQAAMVSAREQPPSWLGAAIVILVWLGTGGVLLFYSLHWLGWGVD